MPTVTIAFALLGILLVSSVVLRVFVFQPPSVQQRRVRLPQRITDLAALCVQAYNAPRLDQIGLVIGPWQLLDIADEGAIWIWADLEQAASYAVVFRGTAHLLDLRACFWLLRASVSGGAVDAWAARADSILVSVKAAFERHGIDPSQHRIGCAGHSLGASDAEWVHHCLRSERSERGERGPLHDAATFDSPGHPAEFRRQRGMPETSAGSSTVMAPSNLINALNVPTAETLYTCGRGSRIPLDAIVALGRSLVRGGEAVVALCCDPAAAFEQHRMRWIIEAIAAGDITASSRELWAQSTWSAFAATKWASLSTLSSTVRSLPRLLSGLLFCWIDAGPAEPAAEPNPRERDAPPPAPQHPP
ncbi:hypothetical protein FA09DRAFT_358686, partial [Tilletiopsis washingtonensis]